MATKFINKFQVIKPQFNSKIYISIYQSIDKIKKNKDLESILAFTLDCLFSHFERYTIQLIDFQNIFYMINNFLLKI